MNKAHTPKGEQGISLLIVLLIGTIMLFTSLAVGQYALRTVTAIRARSDATQTLYTAEQAFACVKYWLNKDYRHFSTVHGGATEDPECNGVTYDFTSPGSDSAPADGHDPSYDSATGIGEFRIPFDASNAARGGVVVEVRRDDPTLTHFDGTVRVYSQSDTEGSSNTSERFQEYRYRVIYGANIMFVVDRSGSIEDGDDRADRTLDTDWNAMLDAVNDSIRLLNRKVPSPFIGLLSFGTDPTDTGNPIANGVEPDVKLTDVITDLINEGAPGDEDDVPEMRTDYAATNLSLGISIAGAELLGKYYPYTGTPPATPLLGYGENSGDFEAIVANGGTFNDLPDASYSGVVGYPNVMVVVTDGAPNGIMTHVEDTWDWSIVDTSNKFFDAKPHTYTIGEAKIFRTPTQAKGDLIVDEMGDVDTAGGGAPATREYQFCDDSSGLRPNNVLSNPVHTNTFPHMAMCNATLIADKLKDEEIIIIAVYVGANDASPEAQWLKNHFVSFTNDAPPKPLFAVIENYEDLQETLLYLFESLDLVQSR